MPTALVIAERDDAWGAASDVLAAKGYLVLRARSAAKADVLTRAFVLDAVVDNKVLTADRIPAARAPRRPRSSR